MELTICTLVIDVVVHSY